MTYDLHDFSAFATCNATSPHDIFSQPGRLGNGDYSNWNWRDHAVDASAATFWGKKKILKTSWGISKMRVSDKHHFLFKLLNLGRQHLYSYHAKRQKDLKTLVSPTKICMFHFDASAKCESLLSMEAVYSFHVLERMMS